jgi:HD-like signal output (HDOD) protein
MNLPLALRRLDVDLPACPRTLVQMMALLRREDAPLSEFTELVEADMALAAAVVRTVNSAMFGLLRRVETVGEALRYLGQREVAAITFDVALRGSFEPTPAMDTLWQQASQAGLLMGRSARALGLDALHAHSAGLFARSGQAVLLQHAGARYEALWTALHHDLGALVAAEIEAFGVSHAAYGSALCASWGLATDVVHHVRDRVLPPERWPDVPWSERRLLGLGAVVDALLDEADVSACVARLEPATACSARELIGAVEPAWTRLHAALA